MNEEQEPDEQTDGDAVLLDDAHSQIERTRRRRSNVVRRERVIVVVVEEVHVPGEAHEAGATSHVERAAKAA